MRNEAFAGGRYAVEKLLGRGGMAAVYLARDRELDRPVAVKTLGEPLSLDDEFVERFRREATTVARLSHPNVVQVFDFGAEAGCLFIVMEYVDGEGLDDVLAREGKLDPDRVLDLAVQACGALDFAHAEGVVHRDIKPANLLLRRDGTLKVVDFGIARAEFATNLTEVGTVLGTASYLSPEQAAGEPVTSQADLYSLGVVLYELYTGEPPRRIESLQQLAASLDDPIRPVRDLAPEVPEHAEAAVMRCLARNPRYRPSSAAELATELRGDPTAVTVRAEPGPRPTGALTAPLTRETRSWNRRDVRRFALGGKGAAIAGATIAVLVAVVLAIAADGGGDSGGSGPAKVEPVPKAQNASGKARNLEEWLRDHTARTP